MTRQRSAAARAKSPVPSPAVKVETPGRKRAAEADAPAKSAQDVLDLEKRRLAVAEDLRHVEQQIYDLETKYLESSSAHGNAIRGYAGFLGGAAGSRKVPLKPEERLFSWSSVTGQSVVKH